MFEIKTPGQLNSLNKAELVALVLQIQESYTKKLEEVASADVVQVLKQLEASETANRELKEFSNELQNKLEASETANKELSQDVLRLNELLAKAEKKSKADDVITVGDFSIRVLAPKFKFQGRSISIDVLKADEQLVKELLEQECSLIELVN